MFCCVGPTGQTSSNIRMNDVITIITSILVKYLNTADVYRNVGHDHADTHYIKSLTQTRSFLTNIVCATMANRPTEEIWLN